MPRKRKLSIVDMVNNDTNDVNESIINGTMYAIMSNAQMDETFHKKYIKEMQELYKKMDHNEFLHHFLKMIKSAMEAEENNEYAYTTLLFCAKYISSYQCDETHLLVKETFKWLTTHISKNPHIRYRLCQFVNIILNALGVEAALDDCICDSIMTYMIHRLRDMSPNVRVQAILALQRLQVPDNPDDAIVKAYQFHLNADPSPRVRQAVITSMGRNYNTIPYILERLWDIDEKVRRHTYFNMSTYPVKAYKVSQRLTFLEQGLNDRSDMVRKVVTSVMLPQWLENYKRDYISFITALKLDANEAEMERFRKITKVALKEVFKSGKIEELINCVPLEKNEENEFNKCVPYESLTIEVSLYWLCLIEFFQNEIADELDLIIPDLSTFCSYILKFCESQKQNSEEDKWKKMEYQYILLTLIEIIYTYDLGDEIGRENLKQLISDLLKNYDLEGEIVEKMVECTENLIDQSEERLQFFVDIIRDILDLTLWKANDFINDRSLIEKLLEKCPDKNIELKLSTLKVKILDLEEEERNYVERRDYAKAQEIADEKATCNEEYMNLLKPLLVQNSAGSTEGEQNNLSIQHPKKVTVEDITKCLQISFYMVVSKKVSSLTPNVCKLYKDFIRRHIESNQISIRNWALKCGTAFSMLYDQLAKDVYNELYSQFFKNQNTNIWNTSIDCIFELLDRYGFDQFENADKQNKSKKPGRQLYNLELLDVQDQTSRYGVDVVFMMSHILDTCDHVCIIRAIINGLCRLVLHGHIKKDDIVEKLLLKYFNPATESEINQILGVFFENLIQKKKQEYLQPSLLPTIITILSAPYDSPLHEVKPETILKFVIDSTRPQFCSTGLNIHNTIALSFMQEMQNNIANKELAKILSKELITLEISVVDDIPLRNDLNSCCDNILQHELDPKTVTNIVNFKNVLNGEFRNIVQRRTDVEENDEYLSENESNQQINSNTQQENNSVNLQEIVNDIQNAPETEQVQNTTQTEELQNTIETDCNTINKDVQNKNNRIDKNLENSAINNETELTTTDLGKTTPTTFGKDNATNLRHLRKSLNARNSNISDGSTRPAKIRNVVHQNFENSPSQLNSDIVSDTQTNVVNILEENENNLDRILCNESITTDQEINYSQNITINETINESALSISVIEKSAADESEIIQPTPSPHRYMTRNARKSPRIASSKKLEMLSTTEELPAKQPLKLIKPTKSKYNKNQYTLNNKESNMKNLKRTEEEANNMNKQKSVIDKTSKIQKEININKTVENLSSSIKKKDKENLLSKNTDSEEQIQTPAKRNTKSTAIANSVTKNYNTRSTSKLDNLSKCIMTRKRTSQTQKQLLKSPDKNTKR